MDINIQNVLDDLSCVNGTSRRTHGITSDEMNETISIAEPGDPQAHCARPRVVVLGAGITGLAAAHHLIEKAPGPRVLVLEAANRPGGVLRTVREQGFLIEESADSFLTALPYGLALCRRLGMEDQLIPTDRDRRRAFVVSRGRLVPIPDGLMIMAPSRLWPMMTTPILGPWGKLRMGLEWFVRPGIGSDDESLAGFARRRFGRQAYDRLIQPLVGGMYTGDPERLSVRATMPRFVEMERSYRSLIRAALRERSAKGKPSSKGGSAGSGARYGLFAGLRDGMYSLVEALASKLPAGTVRYGTRAERLEQGGGGRWRITGQRAGQPFAMDADGVIVAIPAKPAARLLAGVDHQLSASLDRIPSTSCAVVSLGYRRGQIGHALDGFGFVVPKVEDRQILSGSFSSVKFPGRAPAGMVLLRAFLGGAFRREVLDIDDGTLCTIAARELAGLLAIQGEPLLRRVSRWPEVMPQYELGHLDLVAAIESRVAALPGLALAGNAYHGVGVPQCIQSGEQAAARIFAALASRSIEPCKSPG
jgi:oxygen-dependent protoporphyrinogen oxidase